MLPSKHRNSSMLKLLSSSSSAAAYCRAQALAAATLRTASESESSPFFKALSELTGLNRRNRSLAHRRFFCSDSSGDGGNEGTRIEVDLAGKAAESDAAETKSSSAMSTNPRPEDYLMVLALPLTHRPLFPGFYMPLYVKDPKLLAALQENRKRHAPYCGAFLLKDEPASDTSATETEKSVHDIKGKELYNHLHEVGTLDQITCIQGDQVILIGHRRLRTTEMVSEDPLTVKVDHLKDNPYDKDDDVIKATSFEVISTLRDVLKTSSLWRDHVQTYTQHIGDFSFPRLADFGAAITGGNKVQCQAVLEELNLLEASSSEFNVTHNYLDWLTALPWGNYSDENFVVLRAQKILDKDHYGLNDVKERILEFIAVGKLRGTSQGKVIRLSGPPGVGKTSIGCSIACALNRKFYQFSVGGLANVAEIKVHRRTYIGAMRGKMVQCLKNVGTANPIVPIDEIDKLGGGHAGDPASALLELLDPEQNANFLDHYLDVPIDLSKVLFVCTANVVEMIPNPLLDRMEVIAIAGYITYEKMHIARDYLEKTTHEACGVKPEQVEVTSAAILALIENFCREAGVRNLQKQIEKNYRKIALQLVRQGAISESTVAEEVAEPEEEKEEGVDKSGQNTVGSDTVVETETVETITDEQTNETFVDAVTKLSDDQVQDTGDQTIDLQIAHTVARAILLEKDPQNTFFANSKLHLHIPAGATPKDGPSAGCTMVTSLLSLAMKKFVKKDLAMTGEITLTGRILPIGGDKEKTIAARSSDIKTIIFPLVNRRDFDELAPNVKEGLDVHFVDHCNQIFDLAFGDEQQIKEK
ncbi:hypothetical protein Q3G72_003345 [Acer saccharum]|nr:hypothetical protein Q3G72_003345 [Acer saccharum]